MDIDPDVLAVFNNQVCNTFQKCGISGIHQPGEGLAHQLPAGKENIQSDQISDGAVQPVPTCEIGAEKAYDHAAGSVNICQDMFAVGDKGEGCGSPARKNKSCTQKEIDYTDAEKDQQAAFKMGKLIGMKEVRPCRDENSDGGKNNERAFKTC